MAEAPRIVVGPPGHGDARRAGARGGTSPAKRSVGLAVLSWLATLAVSLTAFVVTAPVPQRERPLRLTVLVGLPSLAGLLVMLTGFQLGK